MSPPSTPEQRARSLIDARLAEAGWEVQDRAELNLAAGQGVAVREVPLAAGHGQVDYLLLVDGRAAGVLEAKPEGHTLTGVERQAAVYAEGLPAGLRAAVSPLPFQYVSTGAVTRFTNLLDPEPRSRPVFSFHRPRTLAECLAAEPLLDFAAGWLHGIADPGEARPGPSSLRSRLTRMPPAETAGLSRAREAVDGGGVVLRLPHQQAVHAQGASADAGGSR